MWQWSKFIGYSKNWICAELWKSESTTRWLRWDGRRLWLLLQLVDRRECVASVDRACSAHIDAVTMADAVTYGYLQTRGWYAPPSPAPSVSSRMRARRLTTGSERRRVERDANHNRSPSCERRRHQSFLTRHGTQSTARWGPATGRRRRGRPGDCATTVNSYVGR